VSPVRYELFFYIPEDILHCHRHENLKSYNNVQVSILESANSVAEVTNSESSLT
jgi:hypothetical protein